MTRYYRYDIEQDDATDGPKKTLKDKHGMSVPMVQMDGVEVSDGDFDCTSGRIYDCEDVGPCIVDGNGRLSGHEPGPVYDADTFLDEEVMQAKAEARDFYKAQLSAAWKGGLEQGDVVRLGDRMVVVGDTSPKTGKRQVYDAESEQDAEALKRAVYDAYERDISTAWMRDKDDEDERDPNFCKNKRKLTRRAAQNAQLEPDEDDGRIAGPVSDGTGRTAAQRMKDEAYQSYEDELVNAWRR